MYQPPHFRVNDTEELFSFISHHPLGLLISAGSAGLIANPLPFIVRRSQNEGGTDCLLAHMARANAQWKAIEAGDEVLVSFMGNHHYITPNWYATKQETGKVVPTWNYQTVQVRGKASIHQDPDWLIQQLTALTDQQEADEAKPWAVQDAPESFVAAQMRGIVGIELSITAIEGKLKVSQNRNAADYNGVIAGLEAKGSDSAADMAEMVRKATTAKPDL
ncbi:FMN-binding negative transcriptional regulator [Allorhizobium terrae]|uniref:FMN-binding negative transcriptional regulator n=1 Tax=Allorhizobium terrae TaxID=1848972 RepID=A0A4S4A5H9_9HYPH|nr:FMN-binding negative transcriptional regulator [Allorhizobium terrae]THF53574.1 FMN-binding negative transcriptional regulator [Allorhizobium terrae]